MDVTTMTPPQGQVFGGASGDSSARIALEHPTRGGHPGLGHARRSPAVTSHRFGPDTSLLKRSAILLTGETHTALQHSQPETSGRGGAECHLSDGATGPVKKALPAVRRMHGSMRVGATRDLPPGRHARISGASGLITDKVAANTGLQAVALVFLKKSWLVHVLPLIWLRNLFSSGNGGSLGNGAGFISKWALPRPPYRSIRTATVGV